ncbi:MAG: hypothetical protein A3C90_02215 [Candidatus Magasanikbacteria bacterium RIFCSPHIGHO2_02_FULL_51_14]|uniref:Nudix hydrolase domain-containing protein n=1 Tax=Candidatus Magasanikbacteria bacterium RIFCSPHIGHO2_02_FULL_51_14 TaxID=1798683 RepID=A0A1F6MRD5_9BACT|nr:MAG: hypothetical protein A3C90_02215 [Candidatus Magasanikbacteria bacterium RIFCSPHIGHO2_02_FULL_51_14]
MINGKGYLSQLSAYDTIQAHFILHAMELPTGTIIVSGPVIIEDGKVLLNKEKKGDKIGPWFFPGGIVEESDASLEAACKREAKEELGIDLEIIKQMRTTYRTISDSAKVTLHHFLAQRTGDIIPGDITVEWGWFDINNLPDNCAPNVYEILKDKDVREWASPRK